MSVAQIGVKYSKRNLSLWKRVLISIGFAFKSTGNPDQIPFNTFSMPELIYDFISTQQKVSTYDRK